MRTYLCDPAISDLLFLHLIDEKALLGFQSGLIRADGTRRPAYAAVRDAYRANGGKCAGTPTRWTHATGVVGLQARFPAVHDAEHVGDWSLNATAAEGASYRAVLVALGPAAATREVVADALAGRGPAKVALSAAGKLRANLQVAIALPQRPVAPGQYVYALQVVPTLAPGRAALVLSNPFTLR